SVTQGDIAKLSRAERLQRQEWLAEVAKMHSSSFVRRSAMVALRDIDSSLVRPISLLTLAHEKKNQNLRETAIKCLGKVGTPEDVQLLEEIAANEEIARFGKGAAVNALDKLRMRFKTGAAKAPAVDAVQPTANQKRFLFDVAFSFAGEDRTVTEQLA